MELYYSSKALVPPAAAMYIILDAEETKEPRKLLRKDRRTEKNVINVHARIVDTFCEMSEQILEFPATPCGSFSMVGDRVACSNETDTLTV